MESLWSLGTGWENAESKERQLSQLVCLRRHPLCASKRHERIGSTSSMIVAKGLLLCFRESQTSPPRFHDLRCHLVAPCKAKHPVENGTDEARACQQSPPACVVAGVVGPELPQKTAIAGADSKVAQVPCSASCSSERTCRLPSPTESGGVSLPDDAQCTLAGTGCQWYCHWRVCTHCIHCVSRSRLAPAPLHLSACRWWVAVGASPNCIGAATQLGAVMHTILVMVY